MIVVVCSAIIKKDNSFLMVKEFKLIATGKWGLPGGKLEEGESVSDAVIREVREETGLTVTSATLFSVVNKPKTHEGNTVIRFIFLCEADQTQHAAEHECTYLEISELEKLESNDLIRGKEVLPLLKRVLDGSEPNLDSLIQTL